MMSESAGHAQRRDAFGLLFAALCAVNGAFVPAFAKLTTDRADPVFVAMASTLFAGACAIVVLGVRRQLSALTRQRPGWLVLVGTLGTAGAYLLFFAGARRSTAIETVLCLQIEPAYALLAAWAFLGHRPTLPRLVGTVMLLAGITLALGGQGFVGSSGVWFLLACPLCWQASHLIVLSKLAHVAPTVLTGARFIYGSVVLAAFWLLAGGVDTMPPLAALPSLLPLLALQGLILTYLGTLLWYQAVTRLDLARTTAIVVPSIPLLSLGASFLLVGEVPSGQQLAGMLLTAIGVLVFVTARRSLPPLPP